jgi:anti-sigma regulatory factor (Ser/Thr protein kinase)
VEPADLMGRLNRELIADFSNVGMFTTMFAGLYDQETRRVVFTNAGQSPILYAPRDGAPQLLEAEDLPVGIIEDHTYSCQTLDLQVGDVLVLATDGFSEAWNTAGEMFGYERLKQVVGDLRPLAPRHVIEGLFQAVENFSSGHPQDDDRTVLVLKAVPMEGSVSLALPAALDALPPVSDVLKDLLRRTAGTELDSRLVYQVELALQELLSNLVEHACGSDVRQSIGVRLSVDPAVHEILIETEDGGVEARLDLEAIHMPDPLLMQEGGYGLALIRALVDQTTYRRQSGRNFWKLVKNYSPTSP